MTTTGQQIRAARERAGLTQERLAQLVGVTHRTVGNWERGASVPRNRLAKVRVVLPDLDAGDRSATLHSATDAEVLAEIARRFARTGEDEGHVRSPAITRAEGSSALPIARHVDQAEGADPPPEAVASQQPTHGSGHPDPSG